MNRTALYNLRQASEKRNPVTKTEKDQCQTEALVRKAYSEKLEKWGKSSLRLFKMEHVNYLSKRLIDLPTSMAHLDAGQPWLVYWIVHALRLLCFQLTNQQKKGIISFLRSCQHVDGGFGGGPCQLAHLAPTYGSVNCLASLLSPDALEMIDRKKLGDWLESLRQPDGSFVMHHGGEVDVRGTYCAISVAAVTGLLQSRAKLCDEKTAEWIAKCQTYEGGFGAQPGVEAHGGYTYCAFAALVILGRTDLVDVPRLLRWAAHRQLPTEGGFQGRSHKLVDSCYSFWLGALFPLIQQTLPESLKLLLDESVPLFDTSALQEYILLCCQRVFYMRPGLSVPTKHTGVQHPLQEEGEAEVRLSSDCGGLIDKPGRNADPYHTCYALSGLSVAQHCPRLMIPGDDVAFPPMRGQDVAGSEWGNELADLDPRFNIVADAVAFTRTFYGLLDGGVGRDEALARATESAEETAFKTTLVVEDSRRPSATPNDEAEEEYGGVIPRGSREREESQIVQICTSP